MVKEWLGGIYVILKPGPAWEPYQISQNNQPKKGVSHNPENGKTVFDADLHLKYLY